MNPFYQDNHIKLYAKDCRSMDELPDGSVQCVVTSPPYWGLRKYSGEQELIWGGHGGCEHQWGSLIPHPMHKSGGHTAVSDISKGTQDTQDEVRHKGNLGCWCQLCGAWKGAYGLEPTPEMYVQHTIEILREIRRVLRKDGVCFLNLGDSYASGKGSCFNPGGGNESWKSWNDRKGIYNLKRTNKSDLDAVGLKPKDLCLIPFRIAIAAQEPYQEFTIKELADRAWLAGIIDADGCIGIHHYDRGTYHQFNPFVSVGCSDESMVNRCAAITRCNGSRQVNRPELDGRGVKSNRPHYEWRLEGENAAKILEDIYPYLIVKEKQARVAHALWRNIQDTKDTHKGKGHKTPDSVVRDRLALWELIKRCNQREDVDANLPPVPQHIEPGWWIRSVIIWSKPNPMPESVTDRPTESHEYILMLTKSGTSQYWTHRDREGTRTQPKPDYRWQRRGEPDMKAIAKEIGGMSQRTVWDERDGADRGWREAAERQHSDILEETDIKPEGWTPKNKMGWDRINLWKGHDYYWDADAVREVANYDGRHDTIMKPSGKYSDRNIRNEGANPNSVHTRGAERWPSQVNGQPGRNIRTVWEFPTQPYPEAHFAVFPEKLPELCIKAATPEVGCCSKCGAPWERVRKPTKDYEKALERMRQVKDRFPRPAGDWHSQHAEDDNQVAQYETIGWQPTCKCNAARVPSIVLDPFAGAGTTLWKAATLNRYAVGYEISGEYCQLTVDRCRQQVML